MDRTDGPWAVVTGASSGMGREFARQLAATGLDVVLVARSTRRLEELGSALTADHGVRHRVVTLDLANPDAGTRLDAQTSDLDVGLVVSNAGGARPPGRFLDETLPALHDQVALNATSHLDIAHHFGRRMAARSRGRILLIAANPGRHGLPWKANESAAKGYVVHLADALHHELAPQGVDVAVMVPGVVDTPAIDKIGLERALMPVRPLDTTVAVRRTLAALERGRGVIIPNRVLAVAARLTPRAIAIRVNARMLDAAIGRVTPATDAAA